MKLIDLPENKRDSFLTAILRFAYPLYCTTDVTDFDYYFIGTCFPITVGARLFFVFTNHQFKLANGKTILIANPEDTEKLIGIESANVARYESLDLAVFEFSNEELINNLHSLSISQITNPSEEKCFEYAVLGCQRAANVIDYEKKEINVKKGALITELASLEHNQSIFDFSQPHLIGGSNETLSSLQGINDHTQGLSGGPVVAFTINDFDSGDIDLHLIGITTHVSETDKKLYAAHPMELVTALQYRFNIFPWHKDD